MIKLKRQKGDNLKVSGGVCVWEREREREGASADTTEEISTGDKEKKFIHPFPTTLPLTVYLQVICLV